MAASVSTSPSSLLRRANVRKVSSSSSRSPLENMTRTVVHWRSRRGGGSSIWGAVKTGWLRHHRVFFTSSPHFAHIFFTRVRKPAVARPSRKEESFFTNMCMRKGKEEDRGKVLALPSLENFAQQQQSQISTKKSSCCRQNLYFAMCGRGERRREVG